ncbi:uncharacterized protein UV8b_04055 [Ustilaginoidea virens]|uniref:Uncharacterized protein n=1 Tax=Ustilaginoidea virens TaxID=1159556 RepID=A0A063C8Y2_USTVR|nr:uncharacterized protein UV8b_04055 [Ustilaginoidea virens]QUC19814.1 hypothetical protein UV8b_04055 [Ustilaginoidea virens]GAO14818.1 hypothetical protein UVI_02005470 [Ustilaginoidea virens]
MKSAVLAVAAAAAAVSAHEARSPLDLGVKVGNLVSIDICVGIDVSIPPALSLQIDGCPKNAPPPGRTNVWHPPHHVPMDDCDDNGNTEWHWVQPCGCKPETPHVWATSTVTETQYSTVISCAPTVTNCPARSHGVVTVVVPATTTVCPVAVPATTLATVATSTGPASTGAKSDTSSTPATGAGTEPAATQPPHSETRPVATQPPQSESHPSASQPALSESQPGSKAPPATASCPGCTTPAEAIPETTPCPKGATPVVVPPVGTVSHPPQGNWTQPPPSMAAAVQNSQKVGAVVAIGLAAVFL